METEQNSGLHSVSDSDSETQEQNSAKQTCEQKFTHPATDSDTDTGDENKIQKDRYVFKSRFYLFSRITS